MTILHIIFTLNIGGAETMLVDIVNEQCKVDDVTVCIINDSLNTELLNSIDSRVTVVKLGRKPGSLSFIPFVKLNCYIWRHRPEVIHIHNWQTSRILPPWVKPFFTVHGMGRPATYYKRLKGIIAISEAVKEDVLQRGDYPVVVIPNSIVIDQIKQKIKLERKETFRIVQVGRLQTNVKGQDILIDAIALLNEQGIECITLDIIGEGKSKEELLTQIERLGLQKQVRLLGSMNRRNLYDMLCSYDLLCQPSRDEGFGLTVAEAMAARVPVLVSNIGGPYEIIERGKLGYSFRTEDPKSCAETIQKIKNSYADAEMCAQCDAAYTKAISEYSICQMVKHYREYYLENN